MSDNQQTEAAYTTLSVTDQILEEWDEEKEKMGYGTRSAYIRQHVQAGRKELSQLDPSDSANSDTLQSRVLETIPQESELEGENDAPMPEDVIDAIIEPIKKEITQEIDQLESTGRINFKASYGGYVQNEYS